MYSKQSIRENNRRIIKKSSSGVRNIKEGKYQPTESNEYPIDDEIEIINIPINQIHGKNRRGLSSEQMQSENPEDLNLLFYNFNRKQKYKSYYQKYLFKFL